MKEEELYAAFSASGKLFEWGIDLESAKLKARLHCQLEAERVFVCAIDSIYEPKTEAQFYAKEMVLKDFVKAKPQ